MSFDEHSNVTEFADAVMPLEMMLVRLHLELRRR